MLILGIDTSCDDTCVSVIEIKNQKSKIKSFDIFSDIISSQVKLHAKYGGVYPFLAKREHQRNLPLVFRQATKRIKPSEIDLIGVTNGPGLEPCLWQGVNFARELAEKLDKPLIPINHIEAHILANWLQIQNIKYKIQDTFPAICLVVSGGHTQLILMRDVGKYKLIGETRDDAAGECFDKVARILGLGYPGGPIIAAYAAMKLKVKSKKLKVCLPRPMIYQKNYDFSFSGLKTAVLYDFRNQPPKLRKSKEYIRAICREVQQAIIDVLIHKTLRAAKNFKTKSVILGGGVAANEKLRKQFESTINSQLLNVKFLVPAKNFCTDNAAMVAATVYFHQKEATKNWKKIKVDANLHI
ncbi:MAG: tRNA (adenosine(37)-N6)-threonylcarbamoyltransferase complex transferase subunit TsaD [Patescibacteria group bacterium]|nr:tRNA (adenosine(37)-N6)-threonylcarbamoyltransferase complex transferase subunit TsaD [Patescibacteria group bacterium]